MRGKPVMRDKPVGGWKAARMLAGRIAAGFLCALLAGACSRGAPPSAAAVGVGAAVKPGTYRGVLPNPRGDLPFRVDLSPHDSAGGRFLVNRGRRGKFSER